MDPRERVLRALAFEGPDRPPISHAILPCARLHYGAALEQVVDAVPEDFGWSLLPDIPAQDLPAGYRGGDTMDEWGTLWRVTRPGRFGIPIECPIALDWSNFASYQWPELGPGTPLDAAVPKYRQYSGQMTGESTSYYARGGWITFFEKLQQLHGFEGTLEDLAMREPMIYQLRDDLLQFNLAWLDRWLAEDYQGVQFADDWGAQVNMLVSPSMWRSFFKPVYAEMMGKVKKAGRHVWFHSDGYILPIIPDLIELGVDVLNCQSAVMGLDKLKQFAGQLCFRTDIDRQQVLPFGRPDDVKRHVHELFEALGTPSGGIVACGEISYDVPLANIEAMYEAFLEFRY
jgi:uroporphyrinogen decarboxylase